MIMLLGSTPASTCTFNPVNVWLLQEANKLMVEQEGNIPQREA